VSAEVGAALVRELHQWNLRTPARGHGGVQQRVGVKRELIVKASARNARAHAQNERRLP
jgi:ABC-type proline/glycine betaine transport system ATPase subunit